jgi:hypothetical protein
LLAAGPAAARRLEVEQPARAAIKAPPRLLLSRRWARVAAPSQHGAVTVRRADTQAARAGWQCSLSPPGGQSESTGGPRPGRLGDRSLIIVRVRLSLTPARGGGSPGLGGSLRLVL